MRIPRPIRLLGAIIALLLVAGCATGPVVGTVAVSVSGLPTGIAPSISLVGADSISITAGGSVDVTPGTYAVSVASVLGDGAIVRAIYDGSASIGSVVVSAGGTTNIDVSYARRPGSGRIWMGSSPSAYLPESWSTTGTVSPSLSLTEPSGLNQDIVFGSNSDLYVTTYSGSIVRYAAEDLDTDGAAAAGTVSVSSIPTGLAWHDGRLYVMLFGNQQILRFDEPTSIVGTDAVTPDATITVTGFSGSGNSAALAFDDDGRLWLAFTGALVRIDDPVSPMGTVSVAPDAALTQPVTENRLALFYASDALFTADCASGSGTEVQRYDGVDASSGTSAVAPTATIDVGLSCPVWIGYDASDRFWVADTGGDVGRFADLSEVGDGSSLVANVLIDTSFGIDGGGVAFQAVELP